MNTAQRIIHQDHHFSDAKWRSVAANDDVHGCTSVASAGCARATNAAGFQPALFIKPRAASRDDSTRRDCSRQSSGIHSIHGDNNITAESYGNGVNTTRSFYADNGLAQSIQTGVSGNTTKFQNLSYQWDSAANLYQRASASTGSTSDGLGESLTEVFSYDTGHRLLTANTSGTTGGSSLSRSLSYGYDDLGNITSKTGVGTYAYSGVSAGPHAVTSTTGAYANSYVYDPKGNMTSNGSKTLTYTTYNLPATISDSVSGSTVAFTYGPQEQMIYQEAVENSITTTSKYYEGEYEEVQQGDVIRAKTTLNGVLVYSTVQKANSAAKGYDISYVHEDHLGSTDSVTNRTAALDTRMLFDPFGSRRKPSGADADATYLASLQKTTFETTSNGYTGHEQIDSVQLIHMQGRIYDAVLGRFLSTDENVHYPEISQSYNRYSYVMNNPLSLVDPSGEVDTTTSGGNQETNTTTTNGTNTNCTGDNCTNEQAGEKVNDAQGAKPTGSDAPTTSTAQKVDWNKVAGRVDAAITMLGVALDVLTPADPGVETVAGKAAGSAASKAVKEVGPKLEEAVKTVSKKADPKSGSAGGEGVGKGFSEKVKQQAKSESDNTCVFCKTKTTKNPGPTKSEIDHAIPKSRGGNNTIDNAQNTCRTCNRQKGAKTTEEFIEN